MASRKQEEERRRGNRPERSKDRPSVAASQGGEWDCIRIPEGLEVFKPEANKTYHIDVIPYIAGKFNKDCKPGDEFYWLSYPVYNNLGIDEKKFIAIGELLGVRDPVAEHYAALKKAGTEWDDMKEFKPKWRQLMLIFVHEEAEKGLQLWEGAYGTFGELIDEEIKNGEEDYIDNFDDPDHGATLVVRFKAKNIGQKNPWVLAAKLNFEERESGFDADGDKKLASEILKKAAEICLDDCLKIATYEALKAALDGVPTGIDEEPEEDSAPKKASKPGKPEKREHEEDPFEDDGKKKPGKEPEPEDKPKKGKQPTAEELGIVKGGSVEHDEYGVCTVLRIAEDGQTVSIVDGKDKIHTGVDITDIQPVEEEKPKKGKEKEKEEKPKEEEPKKGKKGKWDDDWD